MEQRQKPERFEPTDDHSIDSTWGIFNALETISAQLDYGLDRLDYLIGIVQYLIPTGRAHDIDEFYQDKEPDHEKV